MKEQMSAPTSGREHKSRACSCLLGPQGQALIHRAVHTTTLPQMRWLHPRCLLGTLLGIHCPQNRALGTIWKSVSWPGQTHARACSKLNIADDGMPVLNLILFSDLVYQRNFTGKTVARGSTGADKPNLNSPCVVIQVWETCLCH